MRAEQITLSPVPVNAYVQRDQPPGRAAARADRRAHAARRAGRELLVPAPSGRVRVDRRAGRSAAACSTWPAARATARRCSRAAPTAWSASTPTPRPTSTRGCATARQNLTFERGLVETYGEPGAFDAVVFLQTIEHVQDPVAVLAHFRSLLAPGGVAYVSTPNLLTLAPPGRREVRQPVAPQGVPGRTSSSALCRAVFDDVELLGLFHARKLRAARARAGLRVGRVHARLRITKPFYDRFTPAIATQRLRAARRPAASTARSTSSPCAR